MISIRPSAKPGSDVEVYNGDVMEFGTAWTCYVFKAENKCPGLSSCFEAEVKLLRLGHLGK